MIAEDDDLISATIHSLEREIERLRAELAAAKAERDQAIGTVKAADRLVGTLIKTHPGAEPIRPVLAWTATPPTEPGEYWTRDDEPGEPILVTVQREPNGELLVNCCDLSDVVEWWGPVPMPPEGKGGVA